MRNSEILKTTTAALGNIPTDWGMIPSIKDGGVVAGPITFVSRSRVSPGDVPQVAAALRSTDVVVAPFLSPMTCAALEEAGISYLDLTGNCWICLNKPKLFIKQQGATRDPNTQKNRGLRSLKGAAAARVVRALCDFAMPMVSTELAKKSRSPTSTVSRVLALLSNEGLIKRGPARSIAAVNVSSLLRRWSYDYNVVSTNETRFFSTRNELDAFRATVRDSGIRHAFGGSFVGNTIKSLVPETYAVCYVDNIKEAATQLDLTPETSLRNVVLLEPYDPVVFERCVERNGFQTVANSQLIVDLLTGPGRGPAHGDAILEELYPTELLAFLKDLE